MIKLIYHRKRQDRHAELQASISPSIFHQISTSTPPWMRNRKRRRKKSRETRGSVSMQVNLIEIQLEYIERRRTSLFKRNLGVTVRPFWSTVTMKRSRWTVSVKSQPSDWRWAAWMIAWMTVIKCLDYRPLDRDRTATILLARSNLDRYNSLNLRTWLMISGAPASTRSPHSVPRRWSNVCDAATSRKIRAVITPL